MIHNYKRFTTDTKFLRRTFDVCGTGLKGGPHYWPPSVMPQLVQD